jgi:hypothetical protein
MALTHHSFMFLRRLAFAKYNLLNLGCLWGSPFAKWMAKFLLKFSRCCLYYESHLKRQNSYGWHSLSLIWRWFHHLSNVYTLYGVCNIIYMCVIVEIICLPHSFSIILQTFYVIPPVSKILDVILYNKRFSIHERRSSTQISSSSINQPEYKMTRQMDKGISLSFKTNLELVCKLKAMGVLSISRWRRKAFPSCLVLGIFRDKVKEGRIHKQSAHLSDKKNPLP